MLIRSLGISDAARRPSCSNAQNCSMDTASWGSLAAIPTIAIDSIFSICLEDTPTVASWPRLSVLRSRSMTGDGGNDAELEA